MSVLEGGYRRIARPVLFRLGHGDAEAAHHATLGALRSVTRFPPVAKAMSLLLARHRSPCTVFGVDFPSPIGLAAGMDKDGVAAKAWAAMGFGFVEFGTVTAQAQPGNDAPRLFRLRASEGIVNRMGFNNAGAAALATTLQQAGKIGIPVGISIGKSKVTPIEQAVPDYLTSLRAVHQYADYIAVNVSSPNTAGLRTLQERGPLGELLGALTGSAAALATGGRPLPVLVKIAPDLTDHAIADLLQVCNEQGIAGVIATNTTLTRDEIATADGVIATESGGLSGAPLRRRALEVVRFVAAHTNLPVIGVGGISTPEHGMAMMDAGASLLQLYTGLVYSGPGLVTGLNRAVVARRRPDTSQVDDDDDDAFGARLLTAMADRGPLCVGIDPHPALLRAWGLPETVAGLQQFADIAVDALAGTAAVLKPQSAFFEAYGSAGIAVLEQLMADVREAGALILLDAKRGDIGSTMDAYAAAYLTDGSTLAADAVTLSPYLGFGSLRPAIDAAKASGRGVFVLALTSNPEGPALQHAIGGDGRSVAQSIADAAAVENRDEAPLGAVGLVVGATVGRTGVDLTHINGPLLAPGLGAQGGTVADLTVVFGENLSAVLPTTSREVLQAGPSVAGLRTAASELADKLRDALAG